MPSSYQQVACGFVDEIEAAIVLRKRGTLRIMENGEEMELRDQRLVDWKAEKGEEFAFTEEGRKIRLDHLLELFGKPAPRFC